MPDKTTRPRATVVSGPVEPLSNGERVQLETEWAAGMVDKLLLIALLGNKDVARTLCEAATFLASDNDALSELIKEGLKKNHGREKKWTPERYKNLLIHYAGAVRLFDGNHRAAKAWLVDYVYRMDGRMLSIPTLGNYISEAIKHVAVNTLPGWAQPGIQARIDRGNQTRK